MNQVNFSGHLSNDCEVRHTPKGLAVINFTLSVERKVRKTDPVARSPMLLRCVVFGEKAEARAKQLKRGAKVFVSGEIDIRNFKDPQGNWQTKVEVAAWDFMVGLADDLQEEASFMNPGPMLQAYGEKLISEEDIPF